MTEGQTLAPGPLENETRSSLQGAGRLLSAGLPGLPQLLRGRWGAGSMALLTWLGMLWIVGTRWGRVRLAVGGDWEERLALANLVHALSASVCWSWRTV